MTLNELKNLKKETLRLMCYATLHKDDWKIIRHAEQKTAGATTAMSESEFSELAASRQEIRNKYHALVSDVENATDENTIQSIVWEN